jgi:hypothetical protein
MTTATARALPLRTTTPSRAPAKAPARRTPLRLVPQRRSTAPRTPFVVVVVSLLGTGLLGLLMLNITVAKGSYALHELSKEQKALQVQEQALLTKVQALEAPGVLAARAQQLGMVPGGPPAFLQLPSGKVLGKPTAGVRPPVAKAATKKPTTTSTSTQGTTTKPTTPSTTSKGTTKPTGSTTGKATRP